MAQTPWCPLDGDPYKPPLGVCAIYSQSTILNICRHWPLQPPQCHVQLPAGDRQHSGGAAGEPQVVAGSAWQETLRGVRVHRCDRKAGSPQLGVRDADPFGVARARAGAWPDLPSFGATGSLCWSVTERLGLHREVTNQLDLEIWGFGSWNLELQTRLDPP